ncbi:hypothetical protein VST7929_00493 [Vibrio stylophorae]|uniref:DUF3261 domain-containing protein n=1 Tax=Vibrio stylophorae TaxID=659351 RepID=A0ABM8ZQT9_9VIBR|nr:hypothetical protein [Vibrio stylophorae]CAH0532653.1 hypothetical protein VST7929_00493 [Vibrio stylophorae]
MKWMAVLALLTVVGCSAQPQYSQLRTSEIMASASDSILLQAVPLDMDAAIFLNQGPQFDRQSTMPMASVRLLGNARVIPQDIEIKTVVMRQPGHVMTLAEHQFEMHQSTDSDIWRLDKGALAKVDQSQPVDVYLIFEHDDALYVLQQRQVRVQAVY